MLNYILICFSVASVDFSFSTLYDSQDFAGKKEVIELRIETKRDNV